MTKLADTAARLRALTELDSTLLVEAAAGTGKTALMAGRVTMLLARGAEPGSIAAITFTELAASALGARVQRYVDDLLAGRVPEPLQSALPDGLTETQRAALTTAADKLDELTATTIHAFCQTIHHQLRGRSRHRSGRAYSRCSTGRSHLRRGLRAMVQTTIERDIAGRRSHRRLIAIRSASRRRDLAGARALSAEAPRRAPTTHRSDRPADVELIEAVADFRRWLSAQPAEPKTLDLVGQLETLANHFAGSFATPPAFDTLWHLAHPPRLACMRRHTFDLLPPRTKTAWTRRPAKTAVRTSTKKPAASSPAWIIATV